MGDGTKDVFWKLFVCTLSNNLHSETTSSRVWEEGAKEHEIQTWLLCDDLIWFMFWHECNNWRVAGTRKVYWVRKKMETKKELTHMKGC